MARLLILSQWRFLVIATAVVLLGVHFLLTLSSPTYSKHTSLSRLIVTEPSNPPVESDLDTIGSGRNDHHTIWQYEPSMNTSRRRANAVFVVLVRNKELWDIVDSMKQLEDRFNHWAGYDWVFFNDEPFDENFKRFTQSVTRSKCSYAQIEKDHWVQPDWINETRATAAREEMARKQVIYADSVSYRNMCRFNSGFFFRHPLLANYDYYWRVEPSVKFYCDIAYDPFLLMQDQKKIYGFTMSVYELAETIPTLWATVKDFIQKYPEYISEGNAMRFLSDDNGGTYNKCHFWSNFEIADLNFWRGEAYTMFFDHLEKTGGFYYERWGDAPVHSIAAALFAKKEQIHFFDDIGYRHAAYQHCPQGDAHAKGRCWCDINVNFDTNGYSCMNQYKTMVRGGT